MFLRSLSALEGRFWNEFLLGVWAGMGVGVIGNCS